MPKITPFKYQIDDAAKARAADFKMIGHEQGLGKTIIGAHVALQGTIIVSPTTAIYNWERTVRDQRPDLNPQVLSKKSDKISMSADVIIVPFSIIADIELPAPYVLIVDESHYIKNPDAARSKVVALLADKADKVYLLSGTPLPNRPIELWTQLRCLRATDLSYGQFARRYANATETRYGLDVSGASNLDELREQVLGPVLIRREKRQLDLPAKFHQIVDIDGKVSAEEARLAAAIELHGSLKAARVSFDELSKYRKITGLRKIEAGIQQAKDLLDGGAKKLLVFAWHTEVVDALVAGLSEYGVITITGADSAKSKSDKEFQFQNDAATRVVVGNILAAGTSLTLTAASTVLFVELDWVPGNIAQAGDRAHRHGQKSNVNILYLVTRGGLDHRFLETIIDKLDVIGQVVGATEHEF